MLVVLKKVIATLILLPLALLLFTASSTQLAFAVYTFETVNNFVYEAEPVIESELEPSIETYEPARATPVIARLSDPATALEYIELQPFFKFTSPTERAQNTVPPRYKIALTFDDGPSRYTSYILDILYQYNSKATFFVLGNRVEDWAETIYIAAQQGNEVVGHSWNHRNFANLTNYEIRSQIYNTSAAIAEVLGRPSAPIFRPPYGVINQNIRYVARDLGYTVVNWSIDPQDWLHRCADHIYNFIMENAVHGSIVVLHDTRESTKEAMVRAIPSLIEQGFELVTVSEILEHLFGELKPGALYQGLR